MVRCIFGIFDKINEKKDAKQFMKYSFTTYLKILGFI